MKLQKKRKDKNKKIQEKERKKFRQQLDLQYIENLEKLSKLRKSPRKTDPNNQPPWNPYNNLSTDDQGNTLFQREKI